MKYASRVCIENGCPEITVSGPTGWRCAAQKKQRSPSSTASTRAFKRLRAEQLKREPLCELCGINMATEVHHREQVAHAPEHALDSSNLQSVCSACHPR